jgi:hypothetical protein
MENKLKRTDLCEDSFRKSKTKMCCIPPTFTSLNSRSTGGKDALAANEHVVTVMGAS